MKTNYSIIKGLINKNDSNCTFTYQETEKKGDIDAFVKRKVLKRRSPNDREYFIVLLGNNTIFNFFKDSPYTNRRIGQIKHFSYCAVAIGLQTIQYFPGGRLNDYGDYWQYQYVLAYDHTLHEFYVYTFEGDVKVQKNSYQGIYEFCCNGLGLVTLTLDRQAYYRVYGKSNLIGNSIIEVTSGGWRQKENEKYVERCGFVVCLGLDGTVTLTGNDANGRSEVLKWKNIIAVDACDTYIVGLTREGKVLSAGENENGRCNVEGWDGIIDIAACEEMTIGLKADGTVISTDNVQGLGELRNIVGVAKYICVKEDGTIVKIYNDGVREFDSLKLWYSKAEGRKILQEEREKINTLVSEKSELTRKYNNTNGLLFKKKKQELQQKISSAESWINYYNNKGIYIIL